MLCDINCVKWVAKWWEESLHLFYELYAYSAGVGILCSLYGDLQCGWANIEIISWSLYVPRNTVMRRIIALFLWAIIHTLLVWIFGCLGLYYVQLSEEKHYHPFLWDTTLLVGMCYPLRIFLSVKEIQGGDICIWKSKLLSWYCFIFFSLCNSCWSRRLLGTLQNTSRTSQVRVRSWSTTPRGTL